MQKLTNALACADPDPARIGALKGAPNLCTLPAITLQSGYRRRFKIPIISAIDEKNLPNARPYKFSVSAVIPHLCARPEPPGLGRGIVPQGVA